MSLIGNQPAAPGRDDVATSVGASQAEALSRARVGALWMLGGGAITAGSYFTSTQTYWISWGPIAYGAYALLRGLSDYLRVGGRAGVGLATVIAVALVGGAAGGTVALAEWQFAQVLEAENRAVVRWNEATDLTDAVFARKTPWGATDAMDMTAAARLFDEASNTIGAALPPLDFGHARFADLRAIAGLLRERAELARRLSASTEAQRTQLLAEWDRLSDRLLRAAGSQAETGTEITAAPPRGASSEAPAATPAPVPTLRPVLLRPDQVILPAGRFPFAGYEVTQDEAHGSWGWVRSFDSPGGNYYFIAVAVYVFGPTELGTTVVAAHDCATYADPGRRPVRSIALTAEVVGDGAKACRHEVGTGAFAYSYIVGARNIAVKIESNPRTFMPDATAMRDLVNLARLQLQIIEAVAPR